MLGMLILGMFFMLFDQRRLVFTSLGACMLLCLYLKSTANSNIILPAKTSAPQVSTALINLSLSSSHLDETMETIKNTHVDVINFQEYTPDWHAFLREELQNTFPHRSFLTRIDPYGMAFYSKYPIVVSDTFFYDRIPNLYARIELGLSSYINLISTHTIPPVSTKAYNDMRNQFQYVAEYTVSLLGPVITMGHFNLPSWTDEISEFKILASLNDSRRDILPVSMHGSVSLMKVPVDHIFYTNDLECTEFAEITASDANHLGIVGNYQLIQQPDLIGMQIH